MVKVLILSGVSGAGKSSFAKAHDAYVLSADDIHINDDGEYVFRRELLGEGHRRCLRRFVELVTSPMTSSPVIVDNTNTSLHEIAPYVAVAQAFGHDVKVVAFVVDPLVAHARTIARGRPTGLDVIMRQDGRFREMLSRFPTHWKLRAISADGT